MLDLIMIVCCLIFVFVLVRKRNEIIKERGKTLLVTGIILFSAGTIIGIFSLFSKNESDITTKNVQSEGEKINSSYNSPEQQNPEVLKSQKEKEIQDNANELKLAKQVMSWFSESKLPINNVRDNTVNQQSLYTGLKVFLSSNPITVMVFENEQSAQKEKNPSLNFYAKGNVVIWIKDESNKDSYLKIFNEQKPIKGLKINYFSNGVKDFVKNMDGYDFISFTKNFYKLSNKEMKTIFNLYLYKHEVTWNGMVIETGKKKVAIWGGNPLELPNSWAEASEDNGKNLAAYVIFLELDEKQVANLRHGDKIRFSGKVSSWGHLKTNDHWKLIEGKVL